MIIFCNYHIGKGMNIINVKSSNNWQDIKDAAMNTIGKKNGKYPSKEWKKNIIMAEHSPIRKLKISWRWVDLPYWVSTHFVRHKFGIEHFVSTQRTDRVGTDRKNKTQDALVTHECEANAQALINISRKRLCACASTETREAWKSLKDHIEEIEPELASCMVKECVYRGFCPEINGCGYTNTKNYKEERAKYIE